MNRKKGQITIFVIIGLVLLFSAVIFFLLRSSSLDSQANSLIKSADKVDEINRPIQQYIETCLSETTIQGLDLIGQHGGYIDPLGPYSKKPFTYDQSNPLNSDGLSLFSDSSSFVPYWFYSKSPVESDSLDVKLRIPSLDEIALDNEEYVQRNILNCINSIHDLESFKGSSIVLSDEIPKVTILYSDNQVISKLELPLTISDSNSKTSSLQSFVSVMDIPFKEVYSVAKSIAISEANDQYLEGMMMNLITRYSGLSMDELPPFVGFKSGYDKLIWTQPQVKQQLENLLNSYVQVININGSENYDSLNLTGLSDSEKLFFNQFTLSSLFSDPSYKIDHLYLNWPIYSKVSPTDDSGLITSITDDSENYGPFFSKPSPDQNYHFFYDFSFPVVVSITKQLPTKNSSYSFNFALESNVRFNRVWTDFADDKGPLSWDPSWIEFDSGEGFPSNNSLVNGSSSNSLDSDYSADAANLFFDSDQFISKNVSFSIFDAGTLDPLPGVFVKVGVGSLISKIIGVSTLDLNGQATFSKKFPLVSNGYVEFQKEGYESLVLPLSTSLETPVDFGSLKLWPLQQVNTTIKIFDMNTLSLENKQPGDTVTLTLVRQSDSPKPFIKTLIFKDNDTSFLTDLIPGTYVVTGTFISKKGETIPAKSKKICDSMISCLMMNKDDEYVPKDPIVMSPMMWGGLEFTENQPIKISKESIYSNKTIEFKVIQLRHPQTIDDLDLLSKVSAFTVSYRSQLLPSILDSTQGSTQGETGDVNQI